MYCRPGLLRFGMTAAPSPQHVEVPLRRITHRITEQVTGSFWVRGRPGEKSENKPGGQVAVVALASRFGCW